MIELNIATHGMFCSLANEMAARGVAARPNLDVILLGKTGVGKSTTANKLINADGNNAAVQAHEGSLRREWPLDDPELEPYRFDSSDGTQSATKRCAVISNTATGFRVMDTRGFAPSDVRGAVYLANLEIMREAVAPRSRTQATRFEDEFTEGDKEKLERIFREALVNAIHNRGDGDLPPCPAIIFIPPNAPSDLVAEIIRNAQVLKPEGIQLEFQKTTCCRCASVIHMRQQEDGVAVAGVEINGQQITAPEDTHCHPVLIPKHTKLVKGVGTVAHVAILGVGVAVERKIEKPLWPSYFSPQEEKCANCGFAPNVKGCVKVGQIHDGVKVEHHHELRIVEDHRAGGPNY